MGHAQFVPIRADALTEPGIRTQAGGNGYRRLYALAKGGMGRVDLCVRESGRFTRLYAIKRLHARDRDDTLIRAMFIDEARVAGLIRHANVVSVLDVGEDEEGPFFVMDYVEGVSLSQLIRHHAQARQRTPIGLGMQVVTQTARGLHAAHELVGSAGEALDLVHRDVSPQNILVGADGIVRVTDFGIAKAVGQSTHTSTGLLKGKIGYMAPEQLRFEPVDRRSDLFTLGVVLYETLALRRLYKAEATAAVARAVLDDPPPDLALDRPDAPPELVQLVSELLAKRRGDRPSSACEVADRLDEIIGCNDCETDLETYVQTRFATELNTARGRIREELAAPVFSEATTEEEEEDLPPARSRGWLLVGSAAAVLGAGVFMLGEGTPDVETASIALEAVSSTDVKLQVESSPSGATVRIGSHRVGETPLTIEVTRAEAVRLHLEREGYAPSRYDLTPVTNERIFVALTVLQPTVAPVLKPASTSTRRPSAPGRVRKKNRRTRRKAKPRAPPAFRRFD